MAMGVGNRGLVGQMNVTPMIDVLLVLIIIFLMISPSSTGLKALIPQPAPHNPTLRSVKPGLRYSKSIRTRLPGRI